MAEIDVTELKQENVQALVEKGMLKAVRETKVKFVFLRLPMVPKRVGRMP